MKPDSFGSHVRIVSYIFFFLFCLVGQPEKLAAQIPFTCQDQFFLTFVKPPTSLNEVLINSQNNVEFQSINSNVGIELNAVGYRSTDNFIYCIAPATRQLVRLDASGTAEILTNLPLNPAYSYFAGDVTPDGRFMFVIGTGTLFTGQNVAAEMARINLESGNYEVVRVPMNTNALIFDIAFNPVSGLLYGYDSNGFRLVRVDENSGAVSFPFPPSSAPGITGSIFFDAFGNLFAYGSSGAFSQTQNRLFQINTQTGASQLLTTGESVEASDGCSCPYTVQLTKTVNRPQAFPCSEIEYTFTIANTSGRTQMDLLLEDVLPTGFTFVGVKSNALAGNVLSQPGDNRFIVSDLQVPVGTHEITILVSVGNVSPKIYKNQARLRNLPASLGGSRLSDNPYTLLRPDSTSIEIIGLPFTSLEVDTTLCTGNESVRLDAGKLAAELDTGVKFVWQDGSTNATFDAPAAGNYRAGIIVGCDTVWVNYAVREAGIRVDLSEYFFEKKLGDSLFVGATATLFNAQVANFQWLDPQPGSVRCPTCPDTWIQAFNDLTYIVRAENEYGCWDTASLNLVVLKNYNVFFPNAIKPDDESDAANGIFIGFGDAATMVERLAVYSRWGELMFEANDISLNDPSTGWDGTFRGKPVPPGVYVWAARLAFLDGNSANLSGDVTVIR